MNLGTRLGLFFAIMAAQAAFTMMYDFQRFYEFINIDDLMGPKEALSLWDTLSMVAKRLGENALLEDEIIDIEKERERCHRYHFDYHNRTARRRLFMGSLIAEDSWWPLHAVATEGYGIYHTVAFIEANSTQTLIPRELRFTPESADIRRLQSGIFGPETLVSVDVTVLPTEDMDPLTREDIQREAIVHRWKQNGMQEDDIGIVVDTDETFSRDFLRAAQICDIPQFRPNQDCCAPKVLGLTLIFEGSPNCITQGRQWFHPDMVLGECIESIGNETLHPTVKRIAGDGRHGGFDREALVARQQAKGSQPLLNGGDIRLFNGGIQYPMREGYDWEELARKTGQPAGSTAFHFHNFFLDASEIRHKYHTYAHPHPNAWHDELGDLHEDLGMMVLCIMNRPYNSSNNTLILPWVVGGLDNIKGAVPLFFADKGVQQIRDEQLRAAIEKDEAMYGTKGR